MESPTLLNTSQLPWENQTAWLPYLRDGGQYIKLPGATRYLQYEDETFGWFVEQSLHYPHLRRALKAWVREDNNANRARVYSFFSGKDLSYKRENLDAVLQALKVDRSILHQRARWLLEHGAHQEAICFAIVLLSHCGNESDLPDLKFLSPLHQFSEFCVEAISKIATDPLQELLELARPYGVDSQAPLLEALEPFAQNDKELSNWIFDLISTNIVVDSRKVQSMARSGDLIGRLRQSEITDDELDSCCRVIEQLLFPPLYNSRVDFIDDSAEITERIIAHLEVRCDRVSRLHTLAILRTWLEMVELPPYKYGPAKSKIIPEWSLEKWSDWLRRCNRIFESRDWESLIREDYTANPKGNFAWDVSELVGVDLWEAEFERQKQDPLLPSDYFLARLIKHASLGAAYAQGELRDNSRISQVFQWAENNWPLDELKTWPPYESFDNKNLRYDESDNESLLIGGVRTLARCQRDEIFNEALSLAALNSAYCWHRVVMVTTLQRIPRTLWGKQIEERLEWLSQHDHDESMQNALEKLNSPTEET